MKHPVPRIGHLPFLFELFLETTTALDGARPATLGRRRRQQRTFRGAVSTAERDSSSSRYLFAQLPTGLHPPPERVPAPATLANQWLTRFRVDIKNLSNERQNVYRQIRGMSAKPMEVNLALPMSWMQPTTIREAKGSETPLPSFKRHMLCDEHGMLPDDFNT